MAIATVIYLRHWLKLQWQYQYQCQGHTIAVPSVYLVLTKVLCCGKKKVSALVVCALFLLKTLMVIQLAFFHCTFLGAAPFNIVSAVAMLTFVVFATVHILAILFALPSLCRQPVAIWMISRGEKWHAIIQTVSLVILIIALFCLSRVVATSRRLTNVEHPDTKWMSKWARRTSYLWVNWSLHLHWPCQHASKGMQQHVVGGTGQP